MNKLILIGNGFDLAHGLKTSYNDFLFWYICRVVNEGMNSAGCYSDNLIELEKIYIPFEYDRNIQTSEDVFKLLEAKPNKPIKYNSILFNRLISSIKRDKWVDVERAYFGVLKMYFTNNSFTNKPELIDKLNNDFNYIIELLISYLQTINENLDSVARLESVSSGTTFNSLFTSSALFREAKVINFNYTNTLQAKRYTRQDDIIHIHGRVSEKEVNPIIFGYGDETDSVYQGMEDSNENRYLEHIKSFGYFKTDNYQKVISYIDSEPFCVFVVGHSCGLSDRILLNEIFEHKNCEKIEILYHSKADGTDNFKETTQQLSRHFKAHNKNLMRRRVVNKNIKNLIPQSSGNG